MITFLKIIVVFVAILVGLAAYSIYSRMPKRFRGKLKPLEKKLFEELRKALSPDAQTLMTAQLEGGKHGCRYYFEKSYTLEIYNSNVDSSFPRKDGSKLGTLTFNYQNIKYTATFQTSVGRIFGVTVRPSPKKFLGKTNIEVVKARIANDPMEPIDLKVVPQYYSETDELPELLKTLGREFKMKNVRKALPETQRSIFIKSSEAKLPDDFLALAKETDGFEINDLTVDGLSTIEPIAMEDGDYLKLAETTAGFITIKQTKRATKLTYFSKEDDTVRIDMGKSFIGALKDALRDPHK